MISMLDLIVHETLARKPLKFVGTMEFIQLSL